jgi:hypothetical protein
MDDFGSLSQDDTVPHVDVSLEGNTADLLDSSTTPRAYSENMLEDLTLPLDPVSKLCLDGYNLSLVSADMETRTFIEVYPKCLDFQKQFEALSQYTGDVRHPTFPDFSFRNGVLHFLTNVQLNLPCKKLSPTYVGPFTIKSFLGDDAIYSKVTDQFRLVNPRVNIAYPWPYRLRTSDIGPAPVSLSSKPVSLEPDGSGWYQIEENFDHRGPTTNNGECLVRLKDFDTNHDTWIRCPSVTPLALCSYEEFLSAHVEYFQRITDHTRHKTDVSRDLASKRYLDSSRYNIRDV